MRILPVLLLAAILAPVARAVPPAHYPLAVDSQASTAPSVEIYQAEERTFLVTFSDDTNRTDISTAPLFMGWFTNRNSAAFSTATWARVDGGTNGQATFTFPAAYVNSAGDFLYGVGAGTTFRQGNFRIIGNPIAVGVPAVPFTTNQNLLGYTFSNFPWLTGIALASPSGTGGVSIVNGEVALTYPAAGAGSGVSATNFYASGQAGLITSNDGNRVWYNLAGTATGTPVYVESDPLSLPLTGGIVTSAAPSAVGIVRPGAGYGPVYLMDVIETNNAGAVSIRGVNELGPNTILSQSGAGGAGIALSIVGNSAVGHHYDGTNWIFFAGDTVADRLSTNAQYMVINRATKVVAFPWGVDAATLGGHSSTAMVRSVNNAFPDGSGNVTIAAGGGSSTNQVTPAPIGAVGGTWTIDFDAGAVQYVTITGTVTAVAITGTNASERADLEIIAANPTLRSVTWPTSQWYWATGLAPSFTTNGWDHFGLSIYSNITRAARIGGSAQ